MLTSFGIYVARILGIVLVMAMIGGRLLLPLWIPLGFVLGAAAYHADFRVRTQAGEVATLKPFRALVAWPFWRNMTFDADLRPHAHGPCLD